MTLHYHRDGTTGGQQPPVILLHGLFGSFENLGVVARALYPRCDVISVDLPNHGRSAHSDGMTYPLVAQALIELLDGLGIDTFNILGHSMGGKVAMQVAVDNPTRVAKLVVADIAPVQYEPKHNQIIAALESVELASIKSRGEANTVLAGHINEAGVRNFLLKSLVKGDNGFAWRFNLPALVKHYPDIGKGLEGNVSYPGPTLFIKGGNSDYIGAEHREVILRYFPNSKAHVVNDAGHWLHAEKPEVFNRIVQRFLFA